MNTKEHELSAKKISYFTKIEPCYFAINKSTNEVGLAILSSKNQLICITSKNGETKCWDIHQTSFIPPIRVTDEELFEIAQNLDQVIELISNINIIKKYKGEELIMKNPNNAAENKERTRYNLKVIFNGEMVEFENCTFIKDESTIRIWTNGGKGCTMFNGNAEFIAEPV